MSETTRGVEDLIGVVLFLTAIGFAVPGWFTNRPDSSRRMQLRLTSWCCVLVGVSMWGLASSGRSSWWTLAFTGIWFFWSLSRCSHWWQQKEAWRKAEQFGPRWIKETR